MMAKKQRRTPIIARGELDHPEHYFDLIREYEGEDRYYPTPLEDLLLEQCGHKCTICSAPYCEIHHIKHLNKGGKTEYENLIVLCPNCHTRVHKENTPSLSQLKHYKLKLEVGYSLPILQRLSKTEKRLIFKLGTEYNSEDLLLFREREHKPISAKTPIEAQKILRKIIGLLELEKSEIITSEYETPIIAAEEGIVFVGIVIRLTPKGIKWIGYLKETKRLETLKS